MEKKCSKCKVVKAFDQFNRNKAKADGLSTECKPCVKVACAAYYAANTDAHNAQTRQWYEKNREKSKADSKAWREANPDKVREIKAAYRKRNREAIKEISKADWIKHNPKRLAKKKEWRAENPEKSLEYVRARQTRKARQMPPWADREAILAVYVEARRLTHETGVKHHVDHYYPLKGELVSGLHVHFNLQAIPALDNHRKSNHLPKEQP